MKASSFISSETKAISQYLAKVEKLVVPAFQRNYAWTLDEVNQFWSDLEESMAAERPQYFLGPMVLKDASKHVEIIDGQQRIVTTLIILGIIRQLYRLRKMGPRATAFEKYFGERDLDSEKTEIVPKVRLNQQNDAAFQKYVVGDVELSDVQQAVKGMRKKDPNYHLLQAITTLWVALQKRQIEMSPDEGDWSVLQNLHKHLQENVIVLFLTVKDEADAAAIFETLNSRGRDLATMDLLKSYIFDKAGGYRDQVKETWAIMRDNLADVDPSERFLHHYWTSLKGRTPRGQLFREMRKDIRDPKSAQTFANQLEVASKAYEAVNTPGHAAWDEYDPATRENLSTLQLLDAQQALPILLAAWGNFSKVEFSKLCRLLVVMAVRYNLIGEKRTGVLANNYVEIPPKIRAGVLQKSAKVAQELRGIYPPDPEFKASFSTKVLRDSAKARYLLLELEKSARPGGERLSDDPKVINLEHILPLKPQQDWADTLASMGPDDLPDYYHRIGNLALAGATAQRKVGSKSFKIKRQQLYASEPAVYTKMLSSYTTWLKADIDRRQAALAEAAVKAWQIESLSLKVA